MQKVKEEFGVGLNNQTVRHEDDSPGMDELDDNLVEREPEREPDYS